MQKCIILRKKVHQDFGKADMKQILILRKLVPSKIVLSKRLMKLITSLIAIVIVSSTCYLRKCTVYSVLVQRWKDFVLAGTAIRVLKGLYWQVELQSKIIFMKTF